MAGNTSSFNDMAEKVNNEMRIAILPVTVFVGVEAVLGFFGNLFVLYVFLFRYHKCNFRYFVLSLALVDITSTLTTMPGEIVTQLYWYIYPEPMVCKVKSFFNMFTVFAEALCLLTIAVDRYRKVCRPLSWQIKHRVAFILCCAIFVAASIVAVPVAFLWGTHQYPKMDEKTGINITVTVCEIDQQYVNWSSPLHYTISTETIISLCLLCMLCLYIFVARTLYKRRKSRAKGQTVPAIKLTILPSTKGHDSRKYIKADVSDEYSSDDKLSDDANLNSNKNTLSVPQINKRRIHLNVSNNISMSNAATRLRKKKDVGSRVRRKTHIMFFLTVVFMVTTVLYLTLLSMIADEILKEMTDSGKAVYFFFFRLYFINHVINPVVYGLMDPHFRHVLQNLKDTISSSRYTSTSHSVSMEK